MRAESRKGVAGSGRHAGRTRAGTGLRLVAQKGRCMTGLERRFERFLEIELFLSASELQIPPD